MSAAEGRHLAEVKGGDGVPPIRNVGARIAVVPFMVTTPVMMGLLVPVQEKEDCCPTRSTAGMATSGEH